MYLCNVVRAEISVFTAPRKDGGICLFYFIHKPFFLTFVLHIKVNNSHVLLP
jgi:hypothetical protein